MKKMMLLIHVIIVLRFTLPAQDSLLKPLPVELEHKGCVLKGTLIQPDKNTPVVLIIAGSGPTNRDGNSALTRNNSLLQLADSLAAYGMGSLRYDKRGIGESSMAHFDESKYLFTDIIDDAAAWIDYLHQQGYKKVFVLGHSEGSLVGMIAAQQKKINGFISVAGAGFSADSLLKKQLAGQQEPIKNECSAIIDSLASGFTVKKVNFLLYSLFRPSVQPYLISWFSYDPAAEIKKLDCPVLIIQGDKDLQISTEDALQLHQSSPAATLKMISGMNHIFKNITGNEKDNMASYRQPDKPVMTEMIQTIVAFINAKTK